MKTIFLLFCCLLLTLSCLITITVGSIYRIKADDPNHPGKCVHKGIVVEPGEKVYNPIRNECCEMECSTSEHEGKTQFYMSYECCQTLLSVKDCTASLTLALAFPDCCSQTLCPGDD